MIALPTFALAIKMCKYLSFSEAQGKTETLRHTDTHTHRLTDRKSTNMS